MTAFTRTPDNTGLLQPTKFLLTFDRIKTVQFYCQSVNIPGINLGQAPLSTPMLDIFAPGNKITYNPLNVHFLVDEKLQGWQELHSWFRSIASPESFSERKRLTEQQNQFNRNNNLKNYSDATLTVLNNLNNPILRIEYTNIFPVSMSDIQFDTKTDADHIITCTATFKYQSYRYLTA